MARPGSGQTRSVEEPAAGEMLAMGYLEDSVREGLKAAFLLAQRGHVTPLSRLVADSVVAIRRVWMWAGMGDQDLLRKLEDDNWGK